MFRSKWLGGVYAVATLVLFTPGPASAQPADKRTYFTFSGAVDMPGVALPAGQYEFRLANPETGRNVVQVLSRDRKRVYGMFFAHSAERITASNNAEVRFMESAAGTPPAIKTWWYPGERTGYEFVYPKQQARRIAQRSRQNVLTTRNETTTTKETNTTGLSRVSPTGSETEVAENEAPETPSPALAGTVASNRTRLPQTASETPFIALMGMLMLAAAATVHRLGIPTA